MSIFKEFVSQQLETKERMATGQIFGPGQAEFSKAEYRKIAKHGYKSNPFMYAGAKLGAILFSDVELKLVRKKRNGEEEEVVPGDKEYALIDSLNDPNEDQSGVDLKEEMYLFYVLSGDNYQHINEPKSRRDTGKVELYNWIPEGVKAVDGGISQPIEKYEVQSGSNTRHFAKEDVIHVKDFNPTSLTNGHSSAYSARYAIDVNNNMMQWNLSLTKNKGVPSFAFTGFSSKDQAKKFQQLHERDTFGKDNAGKNMYLSDVTIQKLGMTAQEMDWNKGIRETGRIILACLQIPSELLNDGENKTYSNFEQAVQAVIMFNTLPTWRKFVSMYNKKLCPRFGDNLELQIDKDSIEALQENMNDKVNRAQALFQSALANRGESRGIAGLDSDVEGSEEFMSSTNLVPFSPGGMDVDEDVSEDELSMNGESDGETN